MDALYARYPFLEAARESVQEADVDLVDVIEGGGPVVDRARARVRDAIEEGRVGPPVRSARTELLSYPVARVLVSLVDEPGLTRRYARAEARTAHERFTADLEESVELRSVEREPIDLDRLLREFDLATAVERTPLSTTGGHEDGFSVSVGPYLELAGALDGDQWRLVNRALADGAVQVTGDEVYELLREAVRARVEDGLPLSVPEEIGAALEPAVDEVRERLADLVVPSPDVVEPGLYPPCVKVLRERAAAGEALPSHSRFALSAFLATIGVETEEIAAEFDGDEAALSEQVVHLRSEDGAEYPPPSCATMQAYGDCVNTDSVCDRVAHPLEYYERRLDGATPDQVSRPESQ